MRSLIRRLLVATVLACLLARTVAAVSYTQFEAIPVSNVAIGFTVANINATTNTLWPQGHPAAQWAYCTVLTNPINIRYDGSAATAAVTGGVTIAAGQSFTLYGNRQLQQFSSIRTGSDATLQCHYTD
jgi:hypothetical protein